MTTLDDFFNKSTESLHPRLRNWNAQLAEAGNPLATLQVYWPEAELGQSEPEMNLQYTKEGKPLSLETVPWDDDLNAGLIQQGIRAEPPQQEAERFALGLRAALRKAEREFGDSYFNAVLVELLKDSELTRYAEIAEVLKHTYTNRVHREDRESGRYAICRELIADAISGRARELTGLLKYTKEEAKRILVAALARYLDDRFSVSSRRRLGLL